MFNHFKVTFVVILFFITSCAFDLVHVKQIPTKITCNSSVKPSFILKKSIHVRLSTGYSRTLKKNTKWEYVGSITEGDVYKTKDQILTVEGSNIFEAYIVVLNKYLMGFYLPVEKSYCPISNPIKLHIEKVKK